MMAHSAAALALFYERERGETTDPATAVIMDFAALPMIDAPARDIAPGPDRTGADRGRAAADGSEA